MPRYRVFSSAIALSLLVVPAIAASTSSCSSGDPTPTPAGCIGAGLAAQPRARFILGQTFYLPVVASQEGCAALSWTVASAPTGNANVVVAGADGVARFTPYLAGKYTFKLGEETTTLEVVPAASAPFHNLNYYAGSSVAEVAGEIWTTDVYAPTVTRLDATTLKELGNADVGAWPVAIAWTKGMTHAVVAQRGSDTLGLVGVASGRIEDAIWIGDEPSNVVVSPDGKTAYVTLATEGAVVAVDLASRAVGARIATGTDPRAMALSADGSTLYVASYRSGHPSRAPYASDPITDERDVTVIDTAKGTVSATFQDVGDTIQGLLLSADGSTLYLTTTLADPTLAINDTTKASFAHVVRALDAKTGKVSATADLSRQASSGGFAVTLHGMALSEGKLWVAAEGSDQAIALDPASLAEVSRVACAGRPRGVVTALGAVYVHGEQGFTVTRLGGGGKDVSQGAAGVDPRPADLTSGQRRFTGTGRTWGQNFACNSCHADGLTDTLVWRVGPNDVFEVSRPQFWLEGTPRVGWSGYVSTAENFAFAGNGTVGVRPTTEEFEGMSAYLTSMMPPPAPTGKTARDGSLSEQASRGKAVYEGKGGCNGCHALPLGTNKQLFDVGVTPGLTDVPSLVGAYRHGVWLKHGEARDLRSAITAVLDYLGNKSLSASEIDDVTRYVEELSARDFFLLRSEPSASSTSAAVDEPIQLSFSYPVLADAANLARFTLVDSAGAAVAAKVTSDGRRVTIKPEAPLAPASKYTLRLDAGLESFGEQKLTGAADVSFTTAAKKALKLEGKYAWKIHVPTFDPTKPGGFDPAVTVEATVLAEATSTAAGAHLALDYGQALARTLAVVIDGKTLRVPPLGVPAGPTFADCVGLTSDLVDLDNDGVADSAAGKLRMTGPGIDLPDVAWELVRAVDPSACNEGTTGTVMLGVTKDAMGVPVLDWGADPGLALYVTSPAAVLPVGPGMVSNGTTYWSLQVETFPTGFAGPVTYGVVPAAAKDSTMSNGGTPGGTPLMPGTCYKFSVVTTKFASGDRTMLWK
jgi:DNA-binding beta-propeller fold protein YncE